MAQPLQNNAPCFCLCLFGTDNKFTFKHVLYRWEFIISQLNELGITVAGISSDGDTRLLKAMRLKMSLGTEIPNFDAVGCDSIRGFHATLLPNFICTQDTVHIGTKLRSRLLKHSIILPLGDFFVTSGHLQVLIDKISKDKHLLSQSDLSPKDKMNFASVVKIYDPKIWALLEEYAAGSEGTRQYLKLIYYVLNSFLSVSISIVDRIYYLWYCVFFLRLWRSWLQTTDYSVTNNCTTGNTYMCIELNAHGLINSVLKCIKDA